MSRIVVATSSVQPSARAARREPPAGHGQIRAGRAALRRWFEPRRRAYPWRGSSDPYRVWVSEVMLQQTQAARVVPAYLAFLERFPELGELARASRRDVLRAWDGLGYNRRAVALSDAARAIERDHGGAFPSDPTELERLPGIGPYTAAAVASIAFGAPLAAIATNVRRVVARMHAGVEAHALGPAEVRGLAQRWLDPADPGTWNQAVMDLGREVCRPRPRCDRCPLSRSCRFRANGATTTQDPRRQPPFEGSFRQVRGAVVRALRKHPSLTVGEIRELVGGDPERIGTAIDRLVREGVLDADPAALQARPGGRVRLPD